MDPEDAMPVGDLLKHCGRSMVYISYDTPVAQLFRDFKRGRSHLAFVLRGRAEVPQNSPSKIGSALGTVAECEGEAGGGAGELKEVPLVIGIVTLEDVLEELLQVPPPPPPP